jgi:hypothetical protein
MRLSSTISLSSLALLLLPAAGLLNSPVVDAYSSALVAAPLATKVVTATVLSVAGDAIAQRRAAVVLTDDERIPELPEAWYDVKRAASFGLFDAAYRGGFQHATFPFIIDKFQGDGLAKLLANGGVDLSVDPNLMAAAERTIFNQGLVVPTIYYPLFFAVTGSVQGLTREQTVARAEREFPRLLSRNILFWVPVQCSQFAFVPVDWQVSYLSAVGLAWTVILSATAGSAKAGIVDPSAEGAGAAAAAAAASSSDESRTFFGARFSAAPPRPCLLPTSSPSEKSGSLITNQEGRTRRRSFSFRRTTRRKKQEGVAVGREPDP